MGRLKGKVAIVTGASRGIGKAIAYEFCQQEAYVCISDINGENLAETEAELKNAGFQVRASLTDVTNREQVEHMVADTVAQWGRVDVLVNNAGITRDNLLFKMSDEDWMLVMDVHLKGAFYCSRAVQKHMVEQGFGRIINISSTSALGNRGQANYATAKAGIQGFTKTLAMELGKFGITTNCIAPGFITTEMTKATAERLGVDFEAFMKARAAEIPVGRAGRPEDIAYSAAFFAADESSFINGQVIYVAGGPKV
ncbi:MAG: beta-ketoacyl-ACP reductase [Bacillota bacterium]|nr:beta-ketoacyl-ACP reductase [Bacillota bacterium]